MKVVFPTEVKKELRALFKEEDGWNMFSIDSYVSWQWNCDLNEHTFYSIVVSYHVNNTIIITTIRLQDRKTNQVLSDYTFDLHQESGYHTAAMNIKAKIMELYLTHILPAISNEITKQTIKDSELV